jgi:hypothetical protein
MSLKRLPAIANPWPLAALSSRRLTQIQAPESAAVNPRAFSTVLHGEAAIALAEDRPRVLNGMKK